jgi:hypothetical protein
MAEDTSKTSARKAPAKTASTGSGPVARKAAAKPAAKTTPTKKPAPAKKRVAAKAPTPVPMPAPAPAPEPAVVTPVSAPSQPISAELRYRMIAEAAYFRAESHQFKSDPVRDWIEAEAEVAARLNAGRAGSPA